MENGRRLGTRGRHTNPLSGAVARIMLTGLAAFMVAVCSCASSSPLRASERAASNVLVFERKLYPPRVMSGGAMGSSASPWSSLQQRDSLLCGAVGQVMYVTERATRDMLPGLARLSRGLDQRGQAWFPYSCDTAALSIDTISVVIRWRWSPTGGASGPLAEVRTVDKPGPRQWYRGYRQYLDAAQEVKAEDVPGLVAKGDDVFSRGDHDYEVDLTVFERAFAQLAHRTDTSSSECWGTPQRIAQMIMAESLTDLERLLAAPELAAKSARATKDHDFVFASQRVFRCSELGK
ncbi:MAG: hypothetical protein HOP12_06805 [Candidatus Eisenbacteria bacterium]|uniref:Uncharacterized protein n=1 Tax=Eiseniibacteriota bacterium TaxID=2212470 RepID=A0A849SJM2_UNCEI|nr:hypothetical protein [Candidatus Eisenbacteria bacterium]